MSGINSSLKPTIAATAVTERLANVVAAEVQNSLGFTAENTIAFRVAVVAALNPVVGAYVATCSSKQLDAILKAAYGPEASPAAAADAAPSPAKKTKESDSSESEGEGEGQEPKKRTVDPMRKEFTAALKAVLKENAAEDAWKGKTKERGALFEQWKAAKGKPAIKLVDKKSPAAPGNLKVITN
jgi:hypothetical protein